MIRERMSRLKKFHPLKILFFVLVAITIFTLLSWIVMALWNFVLVHAINVKSINFWQAAGLLILAKILFGFRFGRRPKNGRSRQRSYWKEKWMNMSEEERIAFKAKWKEKCK